MLLDRALLGSDVDFACINMNKFEARNVFTIHEESFEFDVGRKTTRSS